MIEKYETLKDMYLKVKDWIFAHPKKMYCYIIGMLLLSFLFPFIQYYYFTPKIQDVSIVPQLYSNSDKVKSDLDNNEQKMEIIVKELQQLKTKREDEKLNKNDSLRIEYLYNQYQNLKDGH